ncbi:MULTISPECIES: secondary thiamine-phosphate synthase enzyme YjbQ [Methylobacterium]|jgi:secondary thiamine-phosphate synthase enzyme|nr:MULTISPECIES: secondary thiamine-phosphate synthase enzyme YjbQ [Methylobacterium]MBK3399670.1 YjbQ family protein [Methylobacterium ajmalii]MBK3407122.1 YjbQ family protein [Methylobacterium ajmalii]MBK3423369.1 YjbQ family protein [Methylobacterium ajmalii]MBZ6416967.1 secondary thiamine-phosphate synthase enzyme YjbQ [Methylobacterium sp.]SFE95050.1 secondary thiamine-phosphate synthase enzyme [Methylobacterium sp. yr596]
MRRVEMLASGPVTRQASGRLVVETRGQGFTEITAEVAGFVREAGLRHGLLTVFCRHTSASLTIQENADPDVRTDLMTALDRLAPRDVPYVHGIEGPDDMPAHIRTLLTDAALTIPLVEGRLALGTWQGIYLIEHRDRPHRREIVLHLAGA